MSDIWFVGYLVCRYFVFGIVCVRFGVSDILCVEYLVFRIFYVSIFCIWDSLCVGYVFA